MLWWLLALLLVLALAGVGMRQGGVRAGTSLVALVLAALLCIPVGGLIKLLLSVAGLKHPVLLAFLAPAIAFFLMLIGGKIGGQAAHRKVDEHFKYKGTETQWLMWERLNQRLGLCLGLVNATVYLFLIGIFVSLVGYFTVQASTPGRDSFSLKAANALSRDIQRTGFVRALAPFIPASQAYFDGADILGDIYHTPLLQGRLLRYPAFVPLVEKPEVRALADDVNFQELWLRQPRPSLRELLAHPKFKALVRSRDLYSNAWTVVKTDAEDLRIYLATGKSPKYDPEKILGLWDFDAQGSMTQARRTKPNLGTVELRALRRLFSTMGKATFAATIDGRAVLKIPGANNTLQVAEGTWTRAGAGNYLLTLNEGGKSMQLQAAVAEGNRLVITKDGQGLVFSK